MPTSLRRLHIPGLFWRCATALAVISLLGSDPKLDFWSLYAECVYPPPSTGNTETTRITTFDYDLDGHLTQVNSPEGVINYGYDRATGRHTSTCTTNSLVSYDYDQLGRLKTVTLSKRNGIDLATNEVTTYEYTAVGSRSKVALPNGIVTEYLYDSLNRLTNLTHKLGTNLLASYSYQLHPTGRRTNAVEIVQIPAAEGGGYVTNTFSWSYDGLYRLTNEVLVCSIAGGSYTNQYQYDKVGNRWSKTKLQNGITTLTTNLFNDNDQLLKEITSTNGVLCITNLYNYDANGSLIAKTNTSAASSTVLYTYDLKNKLSSVRDASVTSTNLFLYNDSGARVRSWNSSGGSPTLYLIDANNRTGYDQVLEELTARGATASRSYVIGDDVLGQTSGSTVSWLLCDGHGSTRQLCSPVGAITGRYNYDAYGSGLDSISTSSADDAATRLLYCGDQFDSNVHQYYLRARYYDYGTGRFNARDSFLGNDSAPQSLHKYIYTSCEPVNAKDPTGRFGIADFIITSAILLVIALKFWEIGSAYKKIKHDIFPVTDISAAEVPAFHKHLARLCKDAYSPIRIGIPQWQPLSFAQLQNLGLQSAVFDYGAFSAQLYKSPSENAYVLAFRGTDDIPDWWSNMAQGGAGPLVPSQYDAAKRLAIQVRDALGGAKLTITGHSLGGGLASAAALASDSPAVTFNAAGLNPITELLDGGLFYGQSTRAYSIDGEILTGAQNQSFAPEAYGHLYRLKPNSIDAGASPLQKHSMDVVLRALLY